MSVRVTDNTPQVMRSIRIGASNALRMMAQDVHRASRSITPRERGNLSDDVTIQSGILKTTIAWRQPYAAVQERGVIKGSRIRNYTTPGTGSRFAERSIKKVTDNSDTYFKRYI